MFLLFAAVFAADAARVVVAIARRIVGGDNIDPDRRTFIARLSATAIAVLVAGLGGAAVRSALRSVDVRRIRVKLDRLPRGQHGFTLVQLTDVHVGPTIGREFIDDIVRRTNALEPDLIAITGDLVDGSVEQLRDAVAPLASLRARHGVFFVTGNHEYFSGADAWLNELARLGIRVLRNERVSIGEGEASFDLGGIDDHSAGRYGGLDPAAAVSQALSGRDAKRELVLLAHQPRSLLEAAAVRRRATAVRSHARRTDMAVQVLRSPAAALRRRPASARRGADLRQPRHRVLGPADATGARPPRSRM